MQVCNFLMIFKEEEDDTVFEEDEVVKLEPLYDNSEDIEDMEDEEEAESDSGDEH